MSVRLNKVTKEFNIGLQTAVEFLQKKGFSEVEANPNYKISDEQFNLLQQEFSTDKGLRTEAKMLIQQRQFFKRICRLFFLYSHQDQFLSEKKLLFPR